MPKASCSETKLELIEIPVYSNVFITSLWFACSSAPQMYPRTAKSASSFEVHLWRIFTGKLGEYSFLNWLHDQGILSKKELEKWKEDALSVYWGQTNADRCDFKIENKTIDVKTAPEPTHKHLIIPIDQWENQPKDIYVGLRLRYDLTEKSRLFNITYKQLGEYINRFQKGDKIVRNWKIEVWGFIERESPLWEKSLERGDKICPEKPCYRVALKKLKHIFHLLDFLSKRKLSVNLSLKNKNR